MAVLNAVSQSCSLKSDFFEAKLVSNASLSLESYLDQSLKYAILSWMEAILTEKNLLYCLLKRFTLILLYFSYMYVQGVRGQSGFF